MNRILIAVSVLALALLGTMALPSAGESAQEAPAACGPRFANSPLGRLITGRIGEMLVLRSQLNVTDEQRGQIRGIIEAHRSEIAVAARPIVEKRRALRAAVTADAPNESDIRAAAADLSGALGDAAVLAARIRSEVFAVFTPEQQTLIQESRTERDDAVDGFLDQMAEAK